MILLQAILTADAIILGTAVCPGIITPANTFHQQKALCHAGAPGRQGGMCGEMRLFLDTWAKHQTEQKLGFGALKVCPLHIGTRCSLVHVPSVSGAANRLAETGFSTGLLCMLAANVPLADALAGRAMLNTAAIPLEVSIAFGYQATSHSLDTRLCYGSQRQC